MANSGDDLAYSMLTYNLCHADLLVALSVGRADDAPLFIARPRFNSFYPVSDRILKHLSPADELKTVSYPAESDHNVNCPVGFVLNEGVEFDSWSHFHLKEGQTGMPTEAELASTSLKPIVQVVYFPLIALIIPKWLGIVSSKPLFNAPGCQRVLFLISGSGLPRDPTADQTNNSTQATAELLEFFLENVFCDAKIETVLVHSDKAGMFQYDDNIRFVNEQLRPQIEARRTELARQFGSDWKHRFRLMNTLTSGAPSRMLSIHNALRRFQPHTLHVWQLKSFWHEYPKVAYLKDKDVEFQRFRATELSPPILTTQITDTLIATMVAEMRSHRDSFQMAIDGGDHEIKKFWLRKTHQPVLAILVTQKDGESPKYWRGMNVEVSMPTGSLCSERAAIAAALAQDPTLSRRHFRMIAVLSMPQLQAAVTSTSMRAIFPPETTTHLMLPKSHDELTRSSSAPLHSTAGPIYDRIPSHRASLGSPVLSSSGGSAPPPLTSPISPPMSPSKPAMLATIAHSTSHQAKDLNPLAPCGSCKEWLKKIAECNPDFKVITFTSTSLDNVFVDPVIDWS